jgi:hypothetical protein
VAKAVTAGAAKAIPDLPRRPGARLQLQINPSPDRFLDRLRNSEHRSAGSSQEYEIKEVREPHGRTCDQSKCTGQRRRNRQPPPGLRPRRAQWPRPYRRAAASSAIQAVAVPAPSPVAKRLKMRTANSHKNVIGDGKSTVLNIPSPMVRAVPIQRPT